MGARISRSATLLGLLVVALGCRSGVPAGDVETPAPAPSREASGPIAPDWDASEFVAAEHGFVVFYPVDFEEQPPRAGGLFSAASPMQVPRIDVSVSPTTVPFDDLPALLTQTLGAIGGGATVRSARAVTLRDSRVAAYETVVDWTFQGFGLVSLVLSTRTGAGETVSVMVTGMEGGDLSELSEIAYTLQLEP